MFFGIEISIYIFIIFYIFDCWNIYEYIYVSCLYLPLLYSHILNPNMYSSFILL
jgi:hypothetical protein